jgi:hypothetical protein
MRIQIARSNRHRQDLSFADGSYKQIFVSREKPCGWIARDITCYSNRFREEEIMAFEWDQIKLVAIDRSRGVEVFYTYKFRDIDNDQFLKYRCSDFEIEIDPTAVLEPRESKIKKGRIRPTIVRLIVNEASLRNAVRRAVPANKDSNETIRTIKEDLSAALPVMQAQGGLFDVEPDFEVLFS